MLIFQRSCFTVGNFASEHRVMKNSEFRVFFLYAEKRVGFILHG